ncbi:uncharacterized protein LOC6557767 [Drosophila grimshawi]|uniref:GH15645 n=1 Tax=Drosophila grimshawi TaxID=7222 RepID=B4J077_DROGR|nr:uncharacterized protein LOC6557767 [Drosophila grimshawi]EDV95678.1 GH15645 [Drosophila grimshawi]
MKQYNSSSGLGRCVIRCLPLLLLWTSVLWNASASYAPGTVLDIQLGDVVIEQFRYIPTGGGYEFGYTLPNGTHRDEMGELINDRSTPEDLKNANNYARNGRPSRRPGLKNRKLSPKSLSSLAG